ncbi:rhomboid family intramembrane serine protease [Nanchangia anserum]|uniref:Rhomboid family intramembrane serine protease n=1 Tax=Nanchangia anserum TaxID=2692125 RepID=A0A8I0KU69_9ACTO|nr:rhomboid family intramembrane serine protease [Nanchangia anserum]MBD3689378.1 rhomboid family intramembrane serine protease [Nanchangia anserum]QOX81584.1 rhomboid family intramembrane serine protease [Nanchangia anserum]
MIASFFTDPTSWLHEIVDVARAPLALAVLMWIIQILASTTHHRISRALAIHAWQPTRIWAIATAPLAHGGFGHLIANTIPFVIFGSLLCVWPQPVLPPRLSAVPGIAHLDLFWLVTITAALTSGIGAFVLNRRGSATVGASGLIFGYFGYIVTSGLREGDGQALAIALGIGAVWGISMLRGVIPRFGSRVSWQGHLCGLIGGAGLGIWLYPTA